MLMVDRIVEISHRGAQGRIVAEFDVPMDAWFFQCHFRPTRCSRAAWASTRSGS